MTAILLTFAHVLVRVALIIILAAFVLGAASLLLGSPRQARRTIDDMPVRRVQPTPDTARSLAILHAEEAWDRLPEGWEK